MPRPISEWTPHELLPIIPPSVQCLCVDGSGAKVRWCFSASRAELVEDRPRLDPRELPLGVDREDWLRYFDKSITTATLQQLPVRLVPPPRERIGAPVPRQIATVVDHVVDVAGDHDADGHLPVVRAVGGVEGPAAGVEPDLARGSRARSSALSAGASTNRGANLPLTGLAVRLRSLQSSTNLLSFSGSGCVGSDAGIARHPRA